MVARRDCCATGCTCARSAPFWEGTATAMEKGFGKTYDLWNVQNVLLTDISWESKDPNGGAVVRTVRVASRAGELVVVVGGPWSVGAVGTIVVYHFVAPLLKVLDLLVCCAQVEV